MSNTKQVEILENVQGAPNGFTIVTYQKGDTVTVSEEHAKDLANTGKARIVGENGAATGTEDPAGKDGTAEADAAAAAAKAALHGVEPLPEKLDKLNLEELKALAAKFNLTVEDGETKAVIRGKVEDAHAKLVADAAAAAGQGGAQ